MIALRPAVLFLHGQPGSAADWHGVTVHLGSEADWVAFDRPGWDGRTPALDLDGNARAALAQLDARGVQRAMVVGHSLGAAVAAWMAVSHPDRVSGLVLCAPAANRAALYPLDRWLAAPAVGELWSAATMSGLGVAVSLPAVRRRIAATARIDSDYLRGARRRLLSPSAWRSDVTEQRALIRDLPGLERRLEEIRAPTTILAGTRDRIVPPRAFHALAAQIRGASLVTREGAGHLLPQSDPGFVAGEILAALDSQRRSTLDAR